MAVYVVTGKLGAGKTLVAVGKIREYLESGRKVASNLDIDLKAMLGAKNKNAVYYRIPDKPSIDDLEHIGVGNPSNDESKNGLLVLDECGTWFNSRSWADKARQGVINWFLHARKLGWDIIFLIQDLSIMDKQARVALAEHVVYCRRTDRLTIPVFGGLFKFFTGGRLPMPKIHIAIVRYGDERTSLIVDKWVYRGRNLYAAYDTKQVFSDFYEAGVQQVLPPYFSHGRYIKPKGVIFYMRLTRIIFRKYSRLLFAAVGIAIGASSAFAYDVFSLNSLQARVDTLQVKAESVSTNVIAPYDFEGAVIDSYFVLGRKPEYLIRLSSGNQVSTTDLIDAGYIITSKGRCSVKLYRVGYETSQVTCG